MTLISALTLESNFADFKSEMSLAALFVNTIAYTTNQSRFQVHSLIEGCLFLLQLYYAY